MDAATNFFAFVGLMACVGGGGFTIAGMVWLVCTVRELNSASARRFDQQMTIESEARQLKARVIAVEDRVSALIKDLIKVEYKIKKWEDEAGGKDDD